MVEETNNCIFLLLIVKYVNTPVINKGLKDNDILFFESLFENILDKFFSV